MHNTVEAKEGNFWSESLTYQGGFKDNAFHGYGKEKGSSHEYSGDYEEGAKYEGKLRWITEENEKYEYEGFFNKFNNFHGKGRACRIQVD